MGGSNMDFLNFSNYDLDTWMTFFKEKWIIIAIVLLVLFLIMKVVKTVVKWLLVLVIVAGLIIYSGYSLDDVKEFGSKVTDTLKQEALQAMITSAKDAKYEVNKDGSFTVKASALEVKGKAGSNTVTVSFQGAELGKLEVDSTIKAFIEQAKKNSN